MQTNARVTCISLHGNQLYFIMYTTCSVVILGSEEGEGRGFSRCSSMVDCLSSTSRNLTDTRKGLILVPTIESGVV